MLRISYEVEFGRRRQPVPDRSSTTSRQVIDVLRGGGALGVDWMMDRENDEAGIRQR